MDGKKESGRASKVDTTIGFQEVQGKNSSEKEGKRKGGGEGNVIFGGRNFGVRKRKVLRALLAKG